jgi:hypothetical protein
MGAASKLGSTFLTCGALPTCLPAGLPPPSAAPAAPAEVQQAMLAAPARVRTQAAVPAAQDDEALKALKNRRPQYIHIKQNIWVAKRPK